MAHVNRIDPRYFPLSFADELVQATRFFESLNIDANKYVVKELTAKPHTSGGATVANLFQINDREFPEYYFRVNIHKVSPNNITFKCSAFPGSTTKHEAVTSAETKFLQVFERYQHWTRLMNKYEETSQAINIPFDTSFFQPLYQDFELDEDFETGFIDEKQQNVIRFQLSLLTYIVNEVDVKDSEKTEILNLIESTIENLDQSTKKGYKENIEKVLTKMRSWGVKRWTEIVDVAKKELYKRLVNFSLDSITGFIQSIPENLKQ